MTEKELRELLSFCLGQWDAKGARSLIQMAALEGMPIKDMTDLHYPMMMLLALPSADKGGRPKDPEAEFRKMRERMACAVKVALTGDSFAAVWGQYGRGARPAKLDAEPWRCSAFLQDYLDMEPDRAAGLLRQFNLTLEDLRALYDKDAKKPAEVFMADGGNKGQ